MNFRELENRTLRSKILMAQFFSDSYFSGIRYENAYTIVGLSHRIVSYVCRQTLKSAKLDDNMLAKLLCLNEHKSETFMVPAKIEVYLDDVGESKLIFQSLIKGLEIKNGAFTPQDDMNWWVYPYEAEAKLLAMNMNQEQLPSLLERMNRDCVICNAVLHSLTGQWIGFHPANQLKCYRK